METVKEIVNEVFDNIAAQSSWEDLYSGKLNRLTYNFVTRQRAVEELLEPFVKGKVLDIGCGTGDLVLFYTKKETAYTGVDLSEKMIERANIRYEGLIRSRKAIFDVADCEHLPFDDNQFDVVSAVALIEYLPDSSLALNEMKRVVKNGGNVLITVPYKKSINFAIRDLMEPFRKVIYSFYMKVKNPSLAALRNVKHYHFDQEELDFLMKQRGFEKVDDCFTDFHLIPHPLDHLFPNQYMKISEWIDRRGKDKKYKYLASNYIALYRKV